MAASTQLITDTKSVITNGYSATSKTNAIAAAGPIEDMAGNTNLLLNHLADAKIVAQKIVANVDAGSDGTNLGLLNGILASLV